MAYSPDHVAANAEGGDRAVVLEYFAVSLRCLDGLGQPPVSERKRLMPRE